MNTRCLIAKLLTLVLLYHLLRKKKSETCKMLLKKLKNHHTEIQITSGWVKQNWNKSSDPIIVQNFCCTF